MLSYLRVLIADVFITIEFIKIYIQMYSFTFEYIKNKMFILSLFLFFSNVVYYLKTLSCFFAILIGCNIRRL